MPPGHQICLSFAEFISFHSQIPDLSQWPYLGNTCLPCVTDFWILQPRPPFPWDFPPFGFGNLLWFTPGPTIPLWRPSSPVSLFFFLRIPSSAFFAQPQLFSQCAPWTRSIPRSLLRNADPQGPPQTCWIWNSGVGAQAHWSLETITVHITSKFPNRLLQANVPCEH